MVKVILDTSKFGSKDDRDRIYSLIGISAEGPELVPLPSYFREPISATISITRTLLRKYRCLDVIWVDDRPLGSVSGLPSWVPNWLAAGDLQEETADITTDEQWAVPLPFIDHCLRDEDANVLRLEGIVLANITGLTVSTGSRQGDGDKSQLASGENGESCWQYYQSAGNITRAILRCAYFDMSSFRAMLGSHATFIEHGESPFQHTSLMKALAKPVFRILPSAMDDLALSHAQRKLKGSTSDERDDPRQEGDAQTTAYNRWYERCRDSPVGARPLSAWLMHHRSPFGIFGNVLSLLYFLLFLSFSTFGLGIFFISQYDRVHFTRYDMGIAFATIGGALCLSLFTSTWSTRRWNKKVQQAPHLSGARRRAQRVALTSTGMLGQVCVTAELGDQICLVAGCTRFVVMRPLGTEGGTGNDVSRYRVIGSGAFCLMAGDRDRFRMWPNHTSRNWGHVLRQNNGQMQGTLRKLANASRFELTFDESLSSLRNESWWQEFTVV